MPSDSPSTLEEYADFATDVIDQNPQMNESNTKHKLVDPLISVLGWDMMTDVELEYSVKMGANTKHVDYSLSYDGNPAVFIEAKGCDTKLTDGNRDQLQSYLRQQNVDWGLLTNGDEFEIMRREVEDDNIVVETLETISVDDLAHRTTLLEALSKESIREGKSKRIALEIKQLRDAKSTLQEQKEPLAEEITRLVTDEVGDIISQRVESHAKEFIDAVIDDIVTDRQAQPKPQDDFWKKVEDETGIQKAGEEPSDIQLPDDKTGSDAFVSFVSLLFEEGYLSRDDLPMESGTKWYLLNTERLHTDGSEMFQPKEITDGVYLETKYSLDDLKRRIVELAEYCRS